MTGLQIGSPEPDVTNYEIPGNSISVIANSYIQSNWLTGNTQGTTFAYYASGGTPDSPTPLTAAFINEESDYWGFVTGSAYSLLAFSLVESNGALGSQAGAFLWGIFSPSADMPVGSELAAMSLTAPDGVNPDFVLNYVPSGFSVGLIPVDIGGTAHMEVNGGVSLAGGGNYAYTDALGYDAHNGVTGTAYTLWGSAATTTNTILGPAAVIPNGDLIGCVTVGTVCTLTPVSPSGAPTYTAPGTGAVPVSLAAQFTGTTIIAADYGVVADAILAQGASPTYYGYVTKTGGGSPTDNCTAITHIMNTLGTLGQVQIIWPQGGIATSCAMTLGNGSSSALSTINSVTMIGAGGYQTLTPIGFSSVYTSSFFLAQTGGTEFIYIGTNLGTTPFFTLQGPIFDIHMRGLSWNCRYLCETAVYLTSFEGSDIEDVYAIDTTPYTNIYNGAFWIDAISPSSPISGYSGTQLNRMSQFGTLSAGTLNMLRTLVQIGCGNVSICPDGLDVSGNYFESIQALDYAGLGHGIVLSYLDSNTFDNQFVANGRSLWYVDMLANGFPGANVITGGGSAVGSTAYMTSWTLTQNVTSTYGSGSVTFTTSAGSNSNTPWVGALIAIDHEIMQISSISGTIPTAMTITALRGAAAGLPGMITAAHTSGTAIQGPDAYFIDGTGTCSGATLYFSGAETFAGFPVGARVDEQISQASCGISGVTQGGYKFDFPGTYSASNPFLFSLHAASGTIGNATSPVYFSTLNSVYAPTVPPSYTAAGGNGVSLGQGSWIHAQGRILITNGTGGSASGYATVKLTDATGSTVIEAPSASVPTTAASGTTPVDFSIDINIGYADPTAPLQANLLVTGLWHYGVSGVDNPFTITGSASDHFLTNGLTINMGCGFSTASASLTCTLQGFIVVANQPNLYGIM